MKHFEFGAENPRLMVILCGGLASEHPRRFLEAVVKAHQGSWER